MNPLPPSDVRRQGNRLRRRNNVLAGVGAAVAVAVIVTPLAILGTRGDGDATPDPAPPAPSAPPVRTATIPDGIDITSGMAENESGEPVVATAEGEGVAELVICDAPTLPADGVSDRLAANASGPEYSDARELRTYGSVEEAQAAIEGVVDTLAECPTQDLDTTTWVNTITDGTLGEDSYYVTTTYLENGEPTLGGIVRHVVRVGNAIFVSMSYSEALPGPSFDRSVVKDANKLAPIINGFACEFSDLPCISEGTGPGPIFDGFPLAAGWPEGFEPEGDGLGLEGPGRDIELYTFTPCGVEFPEPTGSDSLGARWSNVEDYRSRALVTFADADEAVAYMAESREFFEGCPQDEIDSQGFQSFWRVVGTEVGGESFAVVQTSEFDGAPAIGMQVLHFIRVGHSVLIDTTANEGGAGPDPVADRTRQIDEQTADAAEVVAEMCAFTEAGC